jgi:hypothetical protein
MSENIFTEVEKKEPHVNPLFLFIANLLIYIGIFLCILLLIDELIPLNVSFIYWGIPMLFIGSFLHRYLTKEREEWRRRHKHYFIFEGEVVVDDVFICAKNLGESRSRFSIESDDGASILYSNRYTILYYCVIINDSWHWVSPITSYVFRYNTITKQSKLNVKVYEKNGVKIIAEANIITLAESKNDNNKNTILEKYMCSIPTHINEFNEVVFLHELYDDEETLYQYFSEVINNFQTGVHFSEIQEGMRNKKFACQINGTIHQIDWPTFQTKKIGDTL